jgi:hypothetical protein
MSSNLPTRLRSIRERIAGGGVTPSLTVLEEAAAHIERLEALVNDLRAERAQRDA